jgi:hypothetical protein
MTRKQLLPMIHAVRQQSGQRVGEVTKVSQKKKHMTSPSRPISLPTTIAPLNAQSMQDEFISDRQLAAVQDQPIGITNNGVARDTPRLMIRAPGTMITD